MTPYATTPSGSTFIREKTATPQSGNGHVHPNLDALVRERLRQRDALPTKTHIQEAARSAVNRPSGIESTHHISLKFAEDLGIIEFLRKTHDEASVNLILGEDLPADHPLAPAQRQIRNIFTTTHTLLQESDFNGSSYVNDQGEIVHVNTAIASGIDSTSPSVPGARIVETNGKRTYTGRIANRDHLRQLAERIIRTENLVAGEVHIVITSFLNNKFSEKALLQAEREACREPLNITVGGQNYTVIPHLFSGSHVNVLERADQSIATFGSQDTTPIDSLQTYINTLITLSNETKDLINAWCEILKTYSLLPEEEIFLRSLICMKAGIPYIYHCKHNKDRTTYAGAAIFAALEKWMALRALTGSTLYDIPENPLQILRQNSFRELILPELPAGHQLSFYSFSMDGTICGENLPRDEKGLLLFDNSLLQPDILTRILPERLVERLPLWKIALQVIVVAALALPLLFYNTFVALVKTGGYVLNIYTLYDVKQAWTTVISFNLIKTHQVKSELWTGAVPPILARDPLETNYGPSDFITRVEALPDTAIQRIVNYFKDPIKAEEPLQEADVVILREIHAREFDSLDLNQLSPALKRGKIYAILKAIRKFSKQIKRHMDDFIIAESRRRPNAFQEIPSTVTYNGRTTVCTGFDVDLPRHFRTAFTIQNSHIAELPRLREYRHLGDREQDDLKESWYLDFVRNLRTLPVFQTRDIPPFISLLFTQASLAPPTVAYLLTLKKVWGNEWNIPNVQNRAYTFTSDHPDSFTLTLSGDFSIANDSTGIRYGNGRLEAKLHYSIKNGEWTEEVSLPDVPLLFDFTRFDTDNGAGVA